MTNYSENPGHVRVERFKPGGKWYDTWQVDMSEFYNEDAGKSLIDGMTLPPTWLAVQKTILKEIITRLHRDRHPHQFRIECDCEVYSHDVFVRWTWVCLDPYHRYAHPIMFVSSKRE